MLRHRILNVVTALVGSGGMAFVHFTMMVGYGMGGIPEVYSDTFGFIFVLGLLCLPVAIILAALLKTRAFRAVLILQMGLIATIYFYGAYLFPDAKQAKQIAYNQKRISWLQAHASMVLPCPQGYQLILTKASPTTDNNPPSRGIYLIHASAQRYPVSLQHSVRGIVMKGNVVPKDVPDPNTCRDSNNEIDYQALLTELQSWNDALELNQSRAQ